MHKQLSLLLFPVFLLVACHRNDPPADLLPGLKITESTVLRADTFRLSANGDQPAITIEGENLTVDFNGAVLIGAEGLERPDLFSGTGVSIIGKNITLKNAVIRGFKVAVFAEGVDSLQLLDCDLSYNYRQRMKSTREAEHLDDWLYYHHNDEDEWLRYGAAAYLKNCDRALVRGLAVTGGQNGLMLTGCNDGLFYNNKIQFNSGIGIGLYRSSRNRVMHNRLDWNVRGYSHGIYARGQDSAGILCYEQSSHNVFAYNSATHSGDGFFLWAGQTTMDTGEGGCNDNMIYGNDFSYAPTNGVEVTFSRNEIVANKLNGCKYGIWGGYSFGSLFMGNEISGCRFGIAIEHGQENYIYGNDFQNDSVGIKVFERGKQPDDWGYAKAKNVSSSDYMIRENKFNQVNIALEIISSEHVYICEDNVFGAGSNFFFDGKKNETISDAFKAACSPEFVLGKIAGKNTVAPLPDAQPHLLDTAQLQGRQYMLIDEWGPYDFQSPSIWLRKVEGGEYTFLLLGPPVGNYKIIDGEGWEKLNRVSGAFPATLTATAKPGARQVSLELEFIGQEFVDQFGQVNKKGEVFLFGLLTVPLSPQIENNRCCKVSQVSALEVLLRYEGTGGSEWTYATGESYCVPTAR